MPDLRKAVRLLSVPFAAFAFAGSVLISPALAQGFTSEQRQEIVGIIRQALKTDPTILSDAILALRATEEKNQASDAATAIRQHQDALSGTPGDYIAGNPHGAVTMVVFYDPRCPYCRKVLPELDSLVLHEPNLRLIEKLIPILGPNSMLEAKAIAAAGRQGKYAALQHSLMTDSSPPGDAQLRRDASDQGIDIARLQRDIADPQIEAGLQADVALAQSLGITGTPSFIVGNQLIPGAVDLDDLKRLVSEAAKAGGAKPG